MLDVKVGARRVHEGRRPRPASWRATMVDSARARRGARVALLTAMDTPLGRAVGNALEVTEAVDDPARRGPGRPRRGHAGAGRRDARAGRHRTPTRRRRSPTVGALTRWRRDGRRPGRRPRCPAAGRGRTPSVVAAAVAGCVTRLDARAVGVAAWRLGAGRARKEDPVSAAAGVSCLAKPGDAVAGGPAVLELHTDDPPDSTAALEALRRRVRHRDAAAARPRRSSSTGSARERSDGDARPSTEHPARPEGAAPRPPRRRAPARDGRRARRRHRLRRPADHRRRRAAPPGSSARRRADDLVRYLEGFDHTVAVMQTPRRARAGGRRVRGGPGRRRGRLRRGALRPRAAPDGGLRLDEVVEAVLAGFRGGRQRAAGHRRSSCAAATGHAHGGPLARDRRARRALPRRRGGRLRHRRRRGRLPAEPPPRRVPASSSGRTSTSRSMPARPSGCRRSGRRCSGAAPNGSATACASSTTSTFATTAGSVLGRLAGYVRDRRVPPRDVPDVERAHRRGGLASPSTRSSCSGGCGSGSRSTPTTG